MEYKNNEGFGKTAKSRSQTLSSRSGQHESWQIRKLTKSPVIFF